MQSSSVKIRSCVQSQEQWAQRVLAHALQRLRSRLKANLRCGHCRIRRRGEIWSVQLEVWSTKRHDYPAASRAAMVGWVGCGIARLHSHWLPGDPRVGQRLLIALAAALAEIAAQSGLGLQVCRWPESLRGGRGRPFNPHYP